VKQMADVELNDPPQIRRDMNRDFYSAVIKVEEGEKFKTVCEKLRYF
jgi:hypothetical protein